jgi:hypothetical protein
MGLRKDRGWIEQAAAGLRALLLLGLLGGRASLHGFCVHNMCVCMCVCVCLCELQYVCACVLM